MNWNTLNSTLQLDLIDRDSEERPVLIFKHSTRCGYSASALDRIESKWQEQDGDRFVPYYLDLLKYRAVSDAIASRYHVTHESPQILVISKGKCICSVSHQDIQYPGLMSLTVPE
jgi:bacillithiol system protein YtxJ